MTINISLNGTWKIIYDSKDLYSPKSILTQKETEITSVPSVFNVSEKGAGYLGVVWYYRKVSIPAYNGIFELYLEGWYGKAEFYLNNIKLGERLYGYTPFSMYFTLPDAKQNESNEYSLIIKIDNREQEGQTFRTPVFKQWGGLHRNIELILHPFEFIKTAFFESKIINQDNQNIKFKLNLVVFSSLRHELSQSNKSTKNSQYKLKSIKILDSGNALAMEIQNPSLDEGDQIAFLKNELGLKRIKKQDDQTFEPEKDKLICKSYFIESTSNFKLWKLDDPILYKVIIETNRGTLHTIQVGFREIKTDNQGQILLNGSPVMFLGVNRHDEHPECGPAFNAQLIKHDLSIMKSHGFTGIRPAHYPTTEFFLNICDQLGIMVMEEIPNYIMMPDMMKDAKTLERGKRMLRETIRAHYNHPSIIAWSVANECKSHLPESKSMINDLCNLGRILDPNRLYHFTGYPGIQNIAEIQANIAGINVYYGDSTAGKKLGPETLTSVLENLRDFMEDEDLAMNDFPIFITEFGSQAHYGYHDIHPYKAEDGYSVPYTIYTEERQAAVIESFFNQVLDKKYVNGLLVWCWRDNRYEPEISDSASAATMKYGILDWTGAPKLGFYVLTKMIEKLKKHRLSK
ncbi:MAG: hypothetical protein GF364_17305 [Candidatus Lokiarchaeota archaeon]|nr:hypothetical protein [Candidatus Lokiarchaeota archaeon]